MTIKSLTVSGFQSHKKTTVHFSEGVNCITGNSDCGKSALLRSLNWLITNKSDDKSFRTKGMNKTDVEVIMSDGNDISRVQDNSGNAYYLVDAKNNLDLDFKAFKNLIPDDILNAINLSEINIQTQFSMPFLLNDSPGEVARTLNNVAGLSDIDSSIANIKKQVLANSREIGTTEQILSDLQVQKDSFAYLPQMEKDVTAYEKLLEQDSELNRAISDLDSLTTGTKRIQEEIASLNSFLKAQTEVDAIASITLELDSVIEAIRQLNSVICDTESNKEAIRELEHFLTAEKEVDSVIELMEELKLIQTEGQALQNIITKIDSNLRKSAELELKMQTDKIKFDAMMGTTCPLCGGKV